MRVGVVCEGPTDFFAIRSFFGHALEVDTGVQPEFIALQPEVDCTNPEAGWGNVLLWLQRNSPKIRIQQYFAGGLFGGGLATPPLDALLIQLDSDILGEHVFTDYVQNTYGFQLGNPQLGAARANQIRAVLELACRFPEMTQADIDRHVIAPAVESTESWCIAAFTTPTPDCELLSGQSLVDAFMAALERSEGREPTLPYAKIDKNIKRRLAFCEKHANGSRRVRNGCQHFETAYQQLKP